MPPKRYGSVIMVKPEKLEYYKELHANPWPQVLATITASNIRNYVIYYRDGYLFSSFEYWGDDFEADMKKMAADPVTQNGGRRPALPRANRHCQRRRMVGAHGRGLLSSINLL